MSGVDWRIVGVGVLLPCSFVAALAFGGGWLINHADQIPPPPAILSLAPFGALLALIFYGARR